MASFRWLCLVSLLLVGFSGYLAEADEVPTYSQCKVHIDAAIKDKAIEPPLADDVDEPVADVSNDAAHGPEDENESPTEEQPVEEAENDVEEEPADNEPEEAEEPETEPEEAAEEVQEVGDDNDDDEATDEETGADDDATPDSDGDEEAADVDANEAPADTDGDENAADDDEEEAANEADGAEAEEVEALEEEKEEAVAADPAAEPEAEDDDEVEAGEQGVEENEEEAISEEAAEEESAQADEEQNDEADDDDKDETDDGEKDDDAQETSTETAEEGEEEGSEPEDDEQAADVNGGESEPAESAEATEEAEPADAGAADEPESDNVEESAADAVESEPEHDNAEPSSADDSMAAEPEVAESAPAEEVQEEAAAEPEVAPVEEASPIQAEAAPVVEEAPVEEEVPVDEAPFEGVIEEEPEVRRSRDHIAEILRLDEEPENSALKKNAVQVTLREVKKVVETAVRPLEEIFKYRDVSNRHFGDNEVFSKPLILFLGPWSGGKSSIINYLLGIEFTKNALKSGAEPSATYFQIMMHGDEEEHMDGTQLAADWTFSGLQKFGQAFIDRLRGKRLPSKLLQKANVVEIPGILEMRREVDRPYPFNDVVQWFVDRADLIFVVYDPTKLDMGLEHEALFDQLKGRQNQVRVLLNKADTVSQEELLLIQNNLMWQLSPLLASPLPPVVYAGSFWSKPYNPESPRRLLAAHEENMLNDIREALDNVVENTIAEARRHAVRVRNHAKMVDCYLTTFFNHKGYFGNKEKVMEDIIENPHQYHIFEGLSTLTNISRYDLPDADVYRDFFKVHKLYQFQNLASTCSFFRGCPIDKLDVAISYELPELIGKYKKRLQTINGKSKHEKKSS